MRAIGSYLPEPRSPRTDDANAGGFETKHGWMSWQDFHDADGKVEYVNGRALIRLPVRYECERYDYHGEKKRCEQWRSIYRDVPDYVLAEAEGREVVP